MFFTLKRIKLEYDIHFFRYFVCLTALRETSSSLRDSDFWERCEQSDDGVAWENTSRCPLICLLFKKCPYLDQRLDLESDA